MLVKSAGLALDVEAAVNAAENDVEAGRSADDTCGRWLVYG